MYPFPALITPLPLIPFTAEDVEVKTVAMTKPHMLKKQQEMHLTGFVIHVSLH